MVHLGPLSPMGDLPPPPTPAQSTSPEPSREDIARWLKDPANREAVVSVLRREARADPRWLSDLVLTEARKQGGRPRL